MKTKNLITVFLLAGLFFSVGCDNSDSPYKNGYENGNGNGYESGSGKEEPPKEEPNLLQETEWKLIGVVDTETGNLKEIENFKHYRVPEPEHYMLIFSSLDAAMQIQDFIAAECYEEGFPAFFTRTPGNFFAGCYEFDFDTQSVRISGFGGTRVDEGDELPSLYHDAFVYVTVSRTPQFFLKENTLRLYFNDKKYYLLFKQIKQ